jgi:zinc protease
MKPICVLLSLCLMLAWPVAAPGQATQNQPTAAATPTVDQLLDKFVQAIGGKAAVQKLSTRVIKGTLEMTTLGMSLAWESYSKAPAKQLSVIEVPAFGTVLEGFNGKTAWSKNPPAGLTEKTGEELAKTRRDANFYRDLELKTIFPNLARKGLEKVADEDAYVLEAKPTAGSLERFYFSTRTGLLVRQDSEVETAAGKTKFQVFAEDYRTVDGIKMPFNLRIIADVPNQPQTAVTIKFTEVKHNVPIDDAKFEKPGP